MWRIERKGLVICLLVGFLGLISVVLGFAAEGTRIKVSQVNETSPGVCSYPRSPAYGLGITSALSLLIAQIIINFASGCICCRRNPYTSTTHWTLALVCFIVSWFTFVVAFLLLLGGAALNDQHEAENVYLGYYYCYVVKPGVFAMASVLSLASVTLSILYFLTISSSKSVGSPSLPNEGGVAMGQAQIPPTSHDPVFVHEDTYIRRQFT
ncbi:protein VASCULATURE COMPLEXITY AND CONNECTIVITY [Silene latifolia]|uniref:protein VASCULATURE COMPLEXITY AND CONNECTIVITY n=1 Tax=Silene latifolia TaxID=37657 RepID=UPI003D7732BF